MGGGMGTQGMGGARGPKPTEEEMQAMVSEAFAAQEADCDGSLTIEESGMDESLFSEIDADSDGLATEG